jgi:hypothetical protein
LGLVVNLLESKRRLEYSALKFVVLGPAFGAGDGGGGPQFARPRQIHHHSGHDRSHDVLNVHLKGKPRVRPGPLDGDLFNRGAPAKVGRFDLRMFKHRVFYKILKRRIGRQGRQLEREIAGAVHSRHGFQIPPGDLLVGGGHSAAPGQRRSQNTQPAQQGPTMRNSYNGKRQRHDAM